MPSQICPHCQQSVEVDPVLRGQAARCPSCGRDLPRKSADGGIAAGLPRALDGAYEPSSRRRGNDDDDFGREISLPGRRKWHYVLVGLKMYWWTMVYMLVASTALGVVQIAWPQDPRDPRPLSPMAAASMIFGCGNMIAGILMLVSMSMCCSAPDPRARRLAFTNIFAMVAMIVVAIGCSVFVFAIIAKQGPRQPQPFDMQALFAEHAVAAIGMGAMLVVIATISYVSWFLFHGAVGTALGNPSLRRIAILLASIWLPLTAISVGVALCPSSVLGVDPLDMVRIQGAVSLVLGLVATGLYLVLGGQTIKTIERGDSP